METTLKIEGMTCGHCVRAVKEALEGVEGVESAEVNLEAKVAKVKHAEATDRKKLIEAVVEEGYEAQEA